MNRNLATETAGNGQVQAAPTRPAAPATAPGSTPGTVPSNAAQAAAARMLPGTAAGPTIKRRRLHIGGMDAFACFWLVFMLVPLGACFQPVAPVWLRAITAASILAFSGFYCWTVSTMRGFPDYPAGTSDWVQLRAILPRLAILILLAVPAVPFLDWWAAYFFPYLTAVLVFATPLRVGATGMFATAAVLITAAALGTSTPGDMWAVLGCSFSSLAILIGRISAGADLRRRVTESQLSAAREREAISRDVHDILGHSLTVLTLKAEVAQRLVTADPKRAQAELAEIVTLSRTALADVRATVSRLRTPDLATVIEEVRRPLREEGLAVRISGTVEEIPEQFREVAAWAVREATTNILRHAHARTVHITLSPASIRISDDGTGLGTAGFGNGLAGLGQRCQDAGAALQVLSPLPGARSGRPGTAVQVTWEAPQQGGSHTKDEALA